MELAIQPTGGHGIMKLKISEHDHQVQVAGWCEIMGKGKYPMLKWIYAVPNGARVAWKTAKKLKAEGMKAGVPDLCLPWPVLPFDRTIGWYHGLYIEMKTKGGRLSADQKDWLEYLHGVGYKAVTAWSADEAIEAIEEYLNGE